MLLPCLVAQHPSECTAWPFVCRGISVLLRHPNNSPSKSPAAFVSSLTADLRNVFVHITAPLATLLATCSVSYYHFRTSLLLPSTEDRLHHLFLFPSSPHGQWLKLRSVLSRRMMNSLEMGRFWDLLTSCVGSPWRARDSIIMPSVGPISQGNRHMCVWWGCAEIHLLYQVIQWKVLQEISDRDAPVPHVTPSQTSLIPASATGFASRATALGTSCFCLGFSAIEVWMLLGAAWSSHLGNMGVQGSPQHIRALGSSGVGSLWVMLPFHFRNGRAHSAGYKAIWRDSGDPAPVATGVTNRRNEPLLWCSLLLCLTLPSSPLLSFPWITSQTRPPAHSPLRVSGRVQGGATFLATTEASWNLKELLWPKIPSAHTNRFYWIQFCNQSLNPAKQPLL